MLAFFATGAVGMYMGLNHGVLYITLLGSINVCLGGLFGCIVLLQKPKVRDSRKKNPNDSK